MTCGHTHKIPLPPIGDSSSTARLADDLALAIHTGRLFPGQPLREVELAAAHNVSRTIVRAALQRLEAQGLAEITLNKGARVRQPDNAALGDMIELHVQLTVLAARHAARRANPEQLARIAQFAGLLAHVSEDGVPADEFQHLRVGFARALFDAAGGALAERLPSAAPVTPHHCRAMADVETREGQADVARLVRDVLIAIEARAPDVAAIAAERMVRRHAERTMPAVLRREMA
jgi:DNA-binding GntR family transcriptional regulator